MSKAKIGSVYFILDSGNEAIKLGFSTNIPRRIKELSTANSNLKLIYQIDNCSMDYEKSLHKYFFDSSNYRISGEWIQKDIVLDWIKHYKLQQKTLKELGLIEN